MTPESTTVERITQRLHFVLKARKTSLLLELFERETVDLALVFTKTKHGADRVVKQLHAAGIAAEAIHGNRSQGQRTRALDAFRSGRSPVLVATDIAARGLDVDGITHVFNYDLPMEPEAYVHRIGRTARAGASGIAISFCDEGERGLLRDIERVTRQAIPRAERGDFEGPAIADRAPRIREHGGPTPDRRGGSGDGSSEGGATRGKRRRGGRGPNGAGAPPKGRGQGGPKAKAGPASAGAPRPGAGKSNAAGGANGARGGKGRRAAWRPFAKSSGGPRR